MINKYILLDEIELRLITEGKDRVRVFDSRDEALDYAEAFVDAWQLIEIPYGDC